MDAKHKSLWEMKVCADIIGQDRSDLNDTFSKQDQACLGGGYRISQGRDVCLNPSPSGRGGKKMSKSVAEDRETGILDSSISFFPSFSLFSEFSFSASISA